MGAIVGVHGTQDVFVGREVVETQVFDRSPKSTDRGWIASKFGLGVDDADLHGPQPFIGRPQGSTAVVPLGPSLGCHRARPKDAATARAYIVVDSRARIVAAQSSGVA